MRFSYVLPDLVSYRDWTEFEGDLACVKRAGYDAVELQIADPAAFDEARVRQALEAAGLPLCAVQTGASYARLIYNFGEPGCGAHQRMKVAKWLLGEISSPVFRRPVRPLPEAEVQRLRDGLKAIGLKTVN